MERHVYVKDREGTSYVALMTEQDVTWYHYLIPSNSLLYA
jgi:hypothetical protein